MLFPEATHTAVSSFFDACSSRLMIRMKWAAYRFFGRLFRIQATAFWLSSMAICRACLTPRSQDSANATTVHRSSCIEIIMSGTSLVSTPAWRRHRSVANCSAVVHGMYGLEGAPVDPEQHIWSSVTAQDDRLLPLLENG